MTSKSCQRIGITTVTAASPEHSPDASAIGKDTNEETAGVEVAVNTRQHLLDCFRSRECMVQSIERRNDPEASHVVIAQLQICA